MISTLLSDRHIHVDFPRLMESTQHTGLVMLFTSDHVATVVATPHDEGVYTVGEHHTDFDPSAFELFDGELSLCNEEAFDVDAVHLIGYPMDSLGDLQGAAGTDTRDHEENHALGSLASAFAPESRDACQDCLQRADCANATKPEPEPDDATDLRGISLAELLAIIAKANATTRAARV